jgi:hypothetical protein
MCGRCSLHPYVFELVDRNELQLAYDDGNGMWISNGVSRDLTIVWRDGVRRGASVPIGRLDYHTPIYSALNSARHRPEDA